MICRHLAWSDVDIENAELGVLERHAVTRVLAERNLRCDGSGDDGQEQSD
jgi:hypothetical protein